MIVYFDASALVKRYAAEPGSKEVEVLIGAADAVGTGVISHAEVAAALGRAVRVGIVSHDDAAEGLAAFNSDWEHILRLQVTEVLAARAAALAWEHGLRGYDAVHLATALMWREAVAEPVTLATYDKALWRSAKATGLVPWPSRSP